MDLENSSLKIVFDNITSQFDYYILIKDSHQKIVDKKIIPEDDFLNYKREYDRSLVEYREVCAWYYWTLVNKVGDRDYLKDLWKKLYFIIRCQTGQLSYLHKALRDLINHEGDMEEVLLCIQDIFDEINIIKGDIGAPVYLDDTEIYYLIRQYAQFNLNSLRELSYRFL